ncbi:MAG: hypothetical protein J6S85_19455 [Methanobrevibacter sp.]|nr:hypothetical protein [Methanobrevibacter sp.]
MTHKVYLMTDLTAGMDADKAEWFKDFIVGSHEDKYNLEEPKKKKEYKPHSVHPNYKDCDTTACQTIMSRCLKRKY